MNAAGLTWGGPRVDGPADHEGVLAAQLESLRHVLYAQPCAREATGKPSGSGSQSTAEVGQEAGAVGLRTHKLFSELHPPQSSDTL